MLQSNEKVSNNIELLDDNSIEIDYSQYIEPVIYDIYDYIDAMRQDSVFPIFDKLTIYNLNDFFLKNDF